MKKINLVSLAGKICLPVFFGLLSVAPSTARAASPETVVETVTSTIAIEKKVHEQGSEWEREQASLQEKIRQARLEEAWYALQVTTFTRYVNTASDRVDELTKTRDELVRMEAELEGVLVKYIDALDSFVRQDAPFLQQERESRLRFLRATADDYELTGAEKLRRTLEALQVELAYGTDVEVTAGAITVAGESRNVRLLRFGRVGLFALSPDGASAWRWQRGQGFVTVDAGQVPAVQQAVTMLESGSVLQLPVLPFGEVK
ncbi:DUF3450 domain-containing protein [Oleidesulfovibrio sp.]|uniref:DUF3450 domain-containing protein n=1 Tax=Oleidesulfovibrio sp. TaxID=2909707 RepID=UPI003A8AFD20